MVFFEVLTFDDAQTDPTGFRAGPVPQSQGLQRYVAEGQGLLDAAGQDARRTAQRNL